MALTIKDLSRMSGFSCATISRVLTNKPNVNPQTRKAILDLIASSGYKSSVYSVMKEISKTNTILAVVNDMDNPFYTGLIHGLQRRVNEAGYLCLVGITEDKPEREVDFLTYAKNCTCAGVVLLTPFETPELKQAIQSVGCPVVLINRYLRSMDLDAVCMDNYRGGYIATEYLIQQGHRRICHCTGLLESTASQERMQGFMDALRDYGIPFDERNIYPGDLKRESGELMGQTFAREKMDFTAIFFANDLMATGFCNEAAKHGIRVPQDVSVMGFDDSPLAEQGPVKLTTVGLAPEVMGGDTARLLLSRMNRSNTDAPHKIVHPPVLHVRESVRAI